VAEHISSVDKSEWQNCGIAKLPENTKGTLTRPFCEKTSENQLPVPAAGASTGAAAGAAAGASTGAAAGAAAGASTGAAAGVTAGASAGAVEAAGATAGATAGAAAGLAGSAPQPTRARVPHKTRPRAIFFMKILLQIEQS